MKDPFCKNELLEPEIQEMVERIRCGHYDPDEPTGNEPDESEGTVWRNPDSSVVNFPPVPMSVRHLPRDTPIEVKARYRGFYVGEGIMIATEKCMMSFAEEELFTRVWIKSNPHRVRIEPEWKVSRMS